MYPGGQIRTGLAVFGGDPRSTVGGGSDAAELGGSVDGTEMTSAWTVMGPTNPKTRARTLIDSVAKGRFGSGSGGPDDGVALGRKQCAVEARMSEI